MCLPPPCPPSRVFPPTPPQKAQPGGVPHPAGLTGLKHVLELSETECAIFVRFRIPSSRSKLTFLQLPPRFFHPPRCTFGWCPRSRGALLWNYVEVWVGFVWPDTSNDFFLPSSFLLLQDSPLITGRGQQAITRELSCFLRPASCSLETSGCRSLPPSSPRVNEVSLEMMVLLLQTSCCSQ